MEAPQKFEHTVFISATTFCNIKFGTQLGFGESDSAYGALQKFGPPIYFSTFKLKSEL